MNEVFLIGKIITDIEFKFIIDSKNISISTFAIETIENKEKIELKAYNEIADFAFQNLVKENVVIINGYIDNDNKIAIKEISRITK